MASTSREIADRLVARATEAGTELALAVQEGERLAALDRVGLCDTPQSEAFDRVTRLVARTLGVPIALVSLVAERRQWFKSRFGVEVTETPREVSFCTHAVAARAPLIVGDATLDARFVDNPLVTAAPHIRAYAGVPLYTSDGHAIGTLCVIDRQPRTFSAAEVAALRDFAAVIEDLIHAMELASENERALYYANERETLFRESFEHAGVGIIHASLSGQLLRANRHMLALVGRDADDVPGLSFADITHPADIPASAGLVHKIVSGAIGECRLDKRYLRRDGSHFWGHLTLTVKRSPSGKPRYLIAVVDDISERKAGEEQLASAHVVRTLEAERAASRVERRLSAVADGTAAMIGYWGSDLTCEFANEAFRGRFGLAAQQILGVTLPDLLATDYEYFRPYVRLVLQGHSQKFERTLQGSGAGGWGRVAIRMTPDLDDAADIRGFLMHMTGLDAF